MEAEGFKSREGQGVRQMYVPYVMCPCQGWSLIGFHKCDFCVSWSQNQIKPQEVSNKSLPESLPQRENYDSLGSFYSAPEGE